MERQGETGTEMNGDQEADTGQGMREKETEMDTDREGDFCVSIFPLLHLSKVLTAYLTHLFLFFWPQILPRTPCLPNLLLFYGFFMSSHD